MSVLVAKVKTCRECGLTSTDLDLFRKRKTGKHGRDNLCKECSNKQAREKHVTGKRNKWSNNRNRDNKVKAIKYLGSKCKKCFIEYNGDNAVIFDFHHRDPSEKEHNPGSLMDNSWERIKHEIDKCDLLCSNCHRLEHKKDNK